MVENGKFMNRRLFLSKTAVFLFGSLFGVNTFSKALAFKGKDARHFFQPRISLIIDDIGLNPSRARQFLAQGIPITFSILPWLSNSHELALEIHRQGHEIMLHQPMEPFDSHINPGPGALYVGDSADRISGVMEKNMSNFPFFIGVNNHMGSKFTERQDEMKEVLKVVKKRGLFFVDSLTTNHSVAYKTAKKFHIFAASRNIFLDNRRDESAILSQLEKLKRHAIRHGRAIGIGHPFPETANAIKQFVKGLRNPGSCLVHISKIIHT